MKLKITKTLLESWAYTFDAAEDYQEEAMADFLATLKREPHEPNENMINGTNFENMCYRMASGENVVKETLLPGVNSVSGESYEGREFPEWYDGAKRIVNIITGGVFQVPVSCDLQLGGRDFWLYGICDVVKAGVIYDIKFRNSSLGSGDVYGKYLHCSQHSLYLRALPEAERFEYLVSDGREMYTEVYTRRETEPIETHITNFIGWLESQPELMKIYEEKWAVDG